MSPLTCKWSQGCGSPPFPFRERHGFSMTLQSASPPFLWSGGVILVGERTLRLLRRAVGRRGCGILIRSTLQAAISWDLSSHHNS